LTDRGLYNLLNEGITMKKYSLTDNKREYEGMTLFQIIAEDDLGTVKKGDLGGWIEKEENLSQEGWAWIADNAEVFGNARVYENANVFENANIYGNARIYGDCSVHDNASVYGDAQIYGEASVCGDAKIHDKACVHGNALVNGNARIIEDTEICGKAKIAGDTWIYGDLKIDSGYFFGIKNKKEEIKYLRVDENNSLIYKGECTFDRY
jgi:carbonic anhydrase/acetyltransferase-like protein (isoleucine patch superfamily)